MNALKVPSALILLGVLLLQGQLSEQFTIANEQDLQSDHLTGQGAQGDCGYLGGFQCVSIKGTCYCFVNKQLPWVKAHDYCRSNKKTLLSIETLREQQEAGSDLLALVVNDPIASQIGVWTSGTYVTAMNRFIWASTAQFFSFANWMSGEPVTTGPTSCVRMIPSVDGSWGVTPCDQWLPFICQE